MARVMIVGESWVIDTMFEAGITPLKEVLERGNHEVRWMPAHEEQASFPLHREELWDLDVLFLSDTGANTFLLHRELEDACAKGLRIHELQCIKARRISGIPTSVMRGIRGERWTTNTRPTGG
jgi:uncharacterized membrane protein